MIVGGRAREESSHSFIRGHFISCPMSPIPSMSSISRNGSARATRGDLLQAAVELENDELVAAIEVEWTARAGRDGGSVLLLPSDTGAAADMCGDAVAE